MSARRMRRAAGARRAGALLAACLLPPVLGSLGERPAPVSFGLDVLPLFERLGCSSAYCHGSATGRGGFKLSLFGSDPRADWLAIREELGGRRLDFVEPEQSLLLRKPTRAMKHGGGRVIEVGSAAYERLRAWIALGAPWGAGEAAAVTALQLERAGERLRAVARLVDGSERDVSDLARYWSSDDAVVTVDREGSVRDAGPGQAWLFARYGGTTARLRVVSGDGLPRQASAMPIDAAWLGALAELGLEPAAAAEPLQLLRRASLDLAGRPPSLAEIRDFLAAPAAERWAAAVDRLLASPELPLVWGEHLSRWLEVKDEAMAKDHEAAQHATLRQRCREFVAAERPLTELPRAVLGGELAPLLRQSADPRDRAELWARTLLGTRIGCARCHDHPLDDFRQDDFLAFAACFADRRPDGSPGQLFDPDSGRAVAPRLLALGDGGGSSGDLAGFTATGGGGRLARVFANRVFAVLLGRGLVEPLDDHRATNPAVLEPLLDALAAELVRVGYEMRALLRAVLLSRLYATASDGEATPLAERCFARRSATALTATAWRRAAALALRVEAPPRALPAAPLAFELGVRHGSLVEDLLRTPGNAVDAVLDLASDDAARLEDLFLLLLTRRPTAEERVAWLPRLVTGGKGFGHDLAFALLASREFGSRR